MSVGKVMTDVGQSMRLLNKPEGRALIMQNLSLPLITKTKKSGVKKRKETADLLLSHPPLAK